MYLYYSILLCYIPSCYMICVCQRRSKTKNFLSIFCRLPPHPPPKKRRKVRKIFGFCSRDRRERTRRADWSVRFNSESPRAPRVRLVAFVRVHLEMQSNFVQYTPPLICTPKSGHKYGFLLLELTINKRI